MEELNFGNILGGQEIDTLFMEPEEPATETGTAAEEPAVEEKNVETDKTTEVVNPETLFEGDAPESVGSGKDAEEEAGGTVPEEGSDTSPQNFYSSIASALAVDGIFPNSEEEAVKKVDSAESFSDLIEAEINSRLDEKQQRVLRALENGVEPSDIRRYENTLSYISSITEAQITEDSEKGEELRKNLIYQDFLNKGYSPEKAQKFTARTIDAGTDVEDAKEALQSNQEFFQDKYNALLKEAQDAAEKEKADRKKEAEKLKDSIMKDKQLFGDMELSADVRKKAFDTISRPVYKDPETGEYLTALQKYEIEHRSDFLKYAGLIYTLTDGFKDFDSFTKGKVKKEVKKGLRELEQTINNTRRSSGGKLELVTHRKDDPESFLDGNFRLAL